jgi:antitoxin (DNA-binding transcriptional repressor) of toxin-antitoxin stability system
MRWCSRTAKRFGTFLLARVWLQQALEANHRGESPAAEAVFSVLRKRPILNWLRFKGSGYPVALLGAFVELGGAGSYIFIYTSIPRATGTARWKNRYHRNMGMVRITETELARDLHAVLAKVQEGLEVIVERDHRPVAVIKPSRPAGRSISEVVSELKARDSTAILDDDFARDIEEGIRAQRQPWNPPSWD